MAVLTAAPPPRNHAPNNNHNNKAQVNVAIMGHGPVHSKFVDEDLSVAESTIHSGTSKSCLLSAAASSRRCWSLNYCLSRSSQSSRNCHAWKGRGGGRRLLGLPCSSLALPGIRTL